MIFERPVIPINNTLNPLSDNPISSKAVANALANLSDVKLYFGVSNSQSTDDTKIVAINDYPTPPNYPNDGTILIVYMENETTVNDNIYIQVGNNTDTKHQILRQDNNESNMNYIWKDSSVVLFTFKNVSNSYKWIILNPNVPIMTNENGILRIR